MTRSERLELCKTCINRKLDLKRGLICKLTDDYADFEETCEEYIEDEKESERLINLNIAATGNNKIGSDTDFKKNKDIGSVIALFGILIALGTHTLSDEIGFIILPYGAIIWGGIQYFKGVEQEKVFNAQQEKKNSQEKQIE